jgi:hypothetical protein
LKTGDVRTFAAVLGKASEHGTCFTAVLGLLYVYYLDEEDKDERWLEGLQGMLERKERLN